MGRQTILQKITDYILTGGRRTTAVNTRDVLNEMANTYMSVIHDTAANFAASNPILETKQIGVASDSLLSSPQYKIGDGINHWNDLPYSSGGAGIPNLQQVTDTGSETTSNMEFFGLTDGFKKVTIHPHDNDEGTFQVYDVAGNSTIELRGARGFKVHDNAYSGNPLFEVIRDDGVDTDKVVINASKTELTQGTASKLLRLNASKEIVSSSYDESDLLPETAATIGAIVNAATGYTTPLDADKIGIWDTLNGLYKAVTWANIKATLKTYFDTIYATISDLNNKTFTIVMSAGVSSPADSTTYYFGIPTASNAAFTTSTDSRYYYISKTCTVKEAYIYATVGGTIGSNEGVTISLETYNVGSVTPVVTTLLTNSLTLEDLDRHNYKVTTGLSIALTAGMIMQIKLLSPVFATNPTLVNFNVYLNCY